MFSSIVLSHELEKILLLLLLLSHILSLTILLFGISTGETPELIHFNSVRSQERNANSVSPKVIVIYNNNQNK